MNDRTEYRLVESLVGNIEDIKKYIGKRFSIRVRKVFDDERLGDEEVITIEIESADDQSEADVMFFIEGKLALSRKRFHVVATEKKIFNGYGLLVIKH